MTSHLPVPPESFLVTDNDSSATHSLWPWPEPAAYRGVMMLMHGSICCTCQK